MMLFLIRFLHQTTTASAQLLRVPGLFLIRFLHQTTTITRYIITLSRLFLIRFLHQTTTQRGRVGGEWLLFLIRFLHQTTTNNEIGFLLCSCSLFDFYIKPQPGEFPYIPTAVVPYSISTSNHNHSCLFQRIFPLFLIRFLHQTTTGGAARYRHAGVVPYSISTSNHNNVLYILFIV